MVSSPNFSTFLVQFRLSGLSGLDWSSGPRFRLLADPITGPSVIEIMRSFGNPILVHGFRVLAGQTRSYILSFSGPAFVQSQNFQISLVLVRESLSKIIDLSYHQVDGSGPWGPETS